MIPSEGDALALHSKFGSSEIIVRHCRTVARVAMILVDGFERRGKRVDRAAVEAAALLHDVGRTRVQTVWHGLRGSEMLRGEGVDDKVAEIVKRHVGAGLASDEARRLGLPEGDYVPRTLDQRIVCFADKLVDSDAVRPFEIEVRRYALKGHDVARLVALKQRLAEELGSDPERLVLDKIKES